MDVGVGLPCTFRDIGRDLLLEWARMADAGPFSSISAGERIAFPNNDLMTMLAVAAGVTERVRLMTSVLVLPLHRPGVITKQIASLDVLSGGRLTVGVGTGVVGRHDDHAVAGTSYEGRAQRFEQQLDLLSRLRAGEPLADGVEPFRTSAPGRPELLVGGASPKALRRAARSADGVITFGIDDSPEPQLTSFGVVDQEWHALGRPGRPRFVAGLYFAFGPDALQRATTHLGPYYEVLGPDGRDWMINTISLTTPQTVSAAIARFADAGIDELYLTPAIPELDQLRQLADVIG